VIGKFGIECVDGELVFGFGLEDVIIVVGFLCQLCCFVAV